MKRLRKIVIARMPTMTKLQKIGLPLKEHVTSRFNIYYEEHRKLYRLERKDRCGRRVIL